LNILRSEDSAIDEETGDLDSPGGALTRPRPPASARGLHNGMSKEITMFYGIGGTILIVLLVLFFLGRL
jgi:hypothetical protein